MLYFFLATFVFVLTHSHRIISESWRERQVQKFGPHRWRLIYSLVSIASFAVLLHAYPYARASDVQLWLAPLWLRYFSYALMLVALVFLAAAYVPRNGIRNWVGGHPMTVSIKTWAFAHLIAQGRLSGVILFGLFLLWGILLLRSARQRPAIPAKPSSSLATAAAVAVGALVWWGLLVAGHRALFGVALLG